MNIRISLKYRVPVAVLAATLTATAAGAATVHRLSIVQTSGSEGAQTVLQTTASQSAFQGEVGGSSANASIKVPFGVLGEFDPASTSTFGIGVAGVSTTGYAVAGEALGGNPSVLGLAGGSGYGVEGVTPSTSGNVAVEGFAAGDGNGGDFFSQTGDALVGTTPGAGGVGVMGLASGTGVEADGFSGTAAAPVISGYDYVGGSDLLGLFAYNSSGPNGESFIVQSSTADKSGGALSGGSDVQVSGDLFVYGHIYQDCNRFPAATGTQCSEIPTDEFTTLSTGSRSSQPERVASYGGRQTLPTVEDFGQAQIVGGRAYVRLDPAFAATTNPGSPYLVFVTPEGDSRGVFTANHTMSGFEIHENAGGRSTMVVDYRIVAKPLGDHSQRYARLPEKRGYAGQRVTTKHRNYKAEKPTMPHQLTFTSFSKQ